MEQPKRLQPMIAQSHVDDKPVGVAVLEALPILDRDLDHPLFETDRILAVGEQIQKVFPFWRSLRSISRVMESVKVEMSIISTNDQPDGVLPVNPAQTQHAVSTRAIKSRRFDIFAPF